GMKVQRARTEPRLGMPLSMPSELRRRGVQAVDVDAISAEIVDKCETVVGRERSEMRVRALLAIFVGPMLRILLGPHGSAQPALRHFETRRRAAAVVGRNKRLPRVVDRTMARA